MKLNVYQYITAPIQDLFTQQHSNLPIFCVTKPLPSPTLNSQGLLSHQVTHRPCRGIVWGLTTPSQMTGLSLIFAEIKGVSNEPDIWKRLGQPSCTIQWCSTFLYVGLQNVLSLGGRGWQWYRRDVSSLCHLTFQLHRPAVKWPQLGNWNTTGWNAFIWLSTMSVINVINDNSRPVSSCIQSFPSYKTHCLPASHQLSRYSCPLEIVSASSARPNQQRKRDSEGA